LLCRIRSSTFKGSPGVCGPIFEEDSEWLQAQLDNIVPLEIPKGQKHLTKFGFVTFTAHTVANTWFGIGKSGVAVTIRAIILEWDCGIGLSGSFYHYGDLVGAITTTLMSNAEKAQPLLRQFFLEPLPVATGCTADTVMMLF